jgi:hypothetical protein
MRFLTPKLREVDEKPDAKLLATRKAAKQAAPVCVH